MAQASKYQVVIVAAAVAFAGGSAFAQHAHDHGHDKGKKKAETKAQPAAEKKADGHDHDPAHDHDHAHTAPHGGTLVVLGDHGAFLEFVLDSEKGHLTAYVLDGEAEKSVRVKQPEIEVKIAPIAEGAASSDATTTTLRLVGVASPLTGEAVGNTSEFLAKSDKLKGLKRFSGQVRGVTIKGSEYKDVGFQFPEGNE